ncbi:MAG: hypothetical protein M3N23_11565, partial [Pseudomonadota bacterium]|nr:hypothetical protein [Pseudomonadota bacterium]
MFSLKTRIAIAVILSTVVTTAVVTYGTIAVVQQGVEASITDAQVALTDRIAADVDQAFRLREQGLAHLAAEIPESVYADGAALNVFLQKHRTQEGLFDNMLVFDARGTLLTTLDLGPVAQRTLVGTDRAYFNDTVRLQHGVVSAPFR